MSASRKVLSGMQEEEGTVSGNTVSAEDGNPFPESGVSGNAIGQNGPDEETVSGNRVPDEETVSGNHVPDAGSAEPDPKSMEPAEEIRADVRPWLQDFTATWVDGHIPVSYTHLKFLRVRCSAKRGRKSPARNVIPAGRRCQTIIRTSSV